MLRARDAPWSSAIISLRTVRRLTVAVFDPFAATRLAYRLSQVCVVDAVTSAYELQDPHRLDLADALVVSPAGAAGAALADVVHAVRAVHRTLPICLACGLDELSGGGVGRALASGVDAVLLEPAIQLTDTLVRILRPRPLGGAEAAILRMLEPVTSPLVKPIVAGLLATAREHPTAVQLASLVGIPRRTCTYRLRRAGFPALRESATWCRVLLAAYTLEHQAASVERVAFHTGFATAASLRAAVARCAPGLHPRDLRRPGAFAELVAQFTAQVTTGWNRTSG